MNISSSAFLNNASIPINYSCDGKNINPPLEIEDIPLKAQSLVLIMDDPDAPLGTWVHWVLFNIDPKIKIIEESSIPFGASQGINSSKKLNYQGPCPPSGIHRYFFKIYALDTKLDLAEGSDSKEIENAMKDHIIDQAQIIGLYGRS